MFHCCFFFGRGTSNRLAAAVVIVFSWGVLEGHLGPTLAHFGTTFGPTLQLGTKLHFEIAGLLPLSLWFYLGGLEPRSPAHCCCFLSGGPEPVCGHCRCFFEGVVTQDS